jgi:Beta-lactamase enzyme family
MRQRSGGLSRPPPSCPGTVPNLPVTADDRASFEALQSTIEGRVGLAVARIGPGRPVEELGTIRGGVAWSTIKVPIALAVVAREPTERDEELIDAALMVSDNAAAIALWERLGPPEAAAAAVQDVLASAGDTATKVETEVLRAGFTPFGQTEWSLAAQVRLMAALPDLPHAEEIRSRMRRVVPEQRWGLGTLGAEVELKGGWGPDPDGRHLVRQMGIVGGVLAVALAAVPADGVFESGTAVLDRLAEWLGQSQAARFRP